ncbi:MAG: hypothetical protein Q7R35_11775 [Elusimicrobiota bacterium]|nr:hypothetical protein [Elusimicrobiota bacterium]
MAEKKYNLRQFERARTAGKIPDIAGILKLGKKNPGRDWQKSL